MKKILSLIFWLLFVAVCSAANYDNYNPIADKVLQPDGSIVSITTGTIIAPANAARAQQYLQAPVSTAKYLQPDGTIINGVPMSTPLPSVISGGTCSTSYTPDLAIGDTYTLILNGACKFNNPTNLVAGKSFVIYITQSGTTRPTFDTAYKWESGSAPTFSSSATKYDMLCCTSFDGTTLQCGAMIDVR